MSRLLRVPFVPSFESGGGGIDSYTKLMLHMNGVNNSTTFADSSSFAPKTVTPNGNAKISTTQSKFGGSSGYFDGTNSYLSIPASSDFLLNGNFTIDFWVYFNSLSSSTEQGIFCQTPDSASFFTLRVTSTYLIISETKTLQTTSYLLTASAWHHIAIVRNNGVIKLFVDGVQINTNWAKTTAYFNGYGITIGKYLDESGYFVDGYLQEFRISNGVARWTSNFTPPTSAYTAV